jgi:hypothetical protein
MKLYDFMCNPDLCGEEFTGPSWTVHREVLARLWDGDPIPPEYHAIAHQLLGCERLPSGRPDELYLAFGRGSGKTRFLALAAVHAWAESYPLLAPGEVATIACHCPSKRQANEWLGYAQGLIEESEVLSAEMANITADTIDSKHRTRLQVFSSNHRNSRGFTMPLAIIDEAAWLTDELSARPDTELRTSLQGTLGRPSCPGGRLIVASSLHRRAGLMWQIWREHYGKVA